MGVQPEITPELREASLRPRFPELAGTRQIVVGEVERVATSCGTGVPRMTLLGQREELVASAVKVGEAGVAAYRERKNRTSIDGLPAPGFEPPSAGT
jgi:hypothetical protein